MHDEEIKAIGGEKHEGGSQKEVPGGVCEERKVLSWGCSRVLMGNKKYISFFKVYQYDTGNDPIKIDISISSNLNMTSILLQK